MPSAFWFMIAIVVTASLCFIPVMVWLTNRAKEREAHYRNETVRRITDAGDSAGALEYLRRLEKADARQTRLKARLAGLITLAAGVGLMTFLHEFAPGAPAYLVGLIPLLVGAALLVFSELMSAARQE